VQTFTVVGVYSDFSTDQGVVLMLMDTYARFWEDPYISAVAAYVAPGADVRVVQDAVRQAVAGTDLIVQSNAALRAGAFAVFDRAFSITIALRLLATVVAFIGILSALLSLQFEQARQYGVMRAVGMTPRQVGVFTLAQTGLMGAAAGLLALPLGLALALVLIYVINVRSFGWTMALNAPAGEFGVALAVALVAALLAGVYPAWRLGRMLVAGAVRGE
jgi:putative ABC transport system permease protein